jgi:hypothetical protein
MSQDLGGSVSSTYYQLVFSTDFCVLQGAFVSFPFAVIHSIVCFFYPLLDNLVVLSLGLLLLCGGQMHRLQSPDAFRCLGSSCSKLYNTISLSLLWEDISFLYCVVWKFDSIWYNYSYIMAHLRQEFCGFIHIFVKCMVHSSHTKCMRCLP